MPLYGFHCGECNKDVELLLGVNETPLCPSCGSARMERQMSRIAPEPKAPGIVKSWRAQAAREGHFSNFSKTERKGV